ncbi:MAG: hypothetical protein DBX59_10515 [Bacillota bacterium]|nr:MAG: hypothetical protein DBX59_10515 [Bacillota bacterium]
MKYFKVKAKCGHVRRGKYILMDFYVKAENGKEAALIVRHKPRVKHDWKDAIESVDEICEIEYFDGKAQMKKNLYFSVTNSSEQRRLNVIDYEAVIELETPKQRKRDKNFAYFVKMNKIIKNDFKKRLAEVI